VSPPGPASNTPGTVDTPPPGGRRGGEIVVFQHPGYGFLPLGEHPSDGGVAPSDVTEYHGDDQSVQP
jgi:hypothetical protein